MFYFVFCVEHVYYLCWAWIHCVLSAVARRTACQRGYLTDQSFVGGIQARERGDDALDDQFIAGGARVGGVSLFLVK